MGRLIQIEELKFAEGPTLAGKAWRAAALAVEPIHVGGGMDRRAAIDLPVVRDPATRLPKIPGSSLAGPLRTAAAIRHGKFPDCAGLGQSSGDGANSASSGHCGQADCQVCTVFGFAKGRSGAPGGFAGLAAIGDMHILLFPVPTASGPAWITCPMVLEQTLFRAGDGKADGDGRYPKPGGDGKVCVPVNFTTSMQLNLGWLLLENAPYNPSNYQDDAKFYGVLQTLGVPGYILEKTVVVPDKLFPTLVNSNLEVRTSVSINPATGAAADKALFTHEALPRGTVFIWEFLCRNPELFQVPGNSGGKPTEVHSPDDVADVLLKAAKSLEFLGVGGMTTRGLGRLQLLSTDVPAATDAESATAQPEPQTEDPSK